MNEKSRFDERLFLFRGSRPFPFGSRFARKMEIPGVSIRAVILDLDGTLVDTAGEIALALNETLAGLGLRPMSLEGVTALIGRGVRSLVERSLEAAGGADLDRAVESFEAHYERVVATRAVLFPGVEEGLRALRDAGFKLGVVTNKPRLFTGKLLKHLDVDRYFDSVVAGDDGLRRKPCGDMLAAAAKNLNAAIGETLMIGDSSNDVLAARDAGCPVWCVPYGYNEGRPAESLECDRMVATVEEAARLLARF
jgi:phosphoglycolate phosphatase